MKTAELIRIRLANQQIANSRCRTPAEVVQTMVAMQAQEFAMARWAIGLRMAGKPVDSDIMAAFNAGEVLRTHALRPTWHFVDPTDIRWLLELTAPRIHTANAYMYRQLDLDAPLFKRSDALLTRALRGRTLTRTALQAVLAKSRIKAEGPRLGYIMMHAELEGLICSGPREGRQFTYSLMEERVPSATPRTRPAALAELSTRYFASRGPASAQDFATWSGLTIRDARAGMDALGKEFTRVRIEDQWYAFLPPQKPAPRIAGNSAFLMPDYDEYGMSYKDRRALFSRKLAGKKLDHNRMILIDGKIVGSWRRPDSGEIETQYPTPLSRAQLRAVTKAVKRFTAFSGSDSDP